MSNDCRLVLSRLVRSGIWSTPNENILKYKRIILDVESIITYLYQLCINRHLERCQRRRQQRRRLRLRPASSSRNPINANKPPANCRLDLYSATIVNYAEYSRYINQLLDFFWSHSMEVILVYRGKYMEAPIFGLLPAQLKKHSQRTCEHLLTLINYDKSQQQRNKSNNHDGDINLQNNLTPWRSNLALNIFKSIVVARRGQHHSQNDQLNAKIQAHQAFYCPYPTLAKLARDFKCPVLTNDAQFIIMDIRAGFILFDQFWNQTVDPPPQETLSSMKSKSISSKTSSNSSSNSKSRSTTTKSPKSSTSATSVSSIRSNRSLNVNNTTAATTTTKTTVRFHYSLRYLRQHPGLTPRLALQLFPLTADEILVNHSKSLVKLKIYDKECQEKDLFGTKSSSNASRRSKKHHEAAARIEQVLTFLCVKSADILAGQIRGETFRLKSSFENDYRELSNYYSVSFDFKKRLKFVLKQRLTNEAPQAPNYIESCLLNRESSADYLLSLLCCSIGHLASVDYNKSLEFEDLNTRRSAHSMLDNGKILLMSLFSDNKSHKAEHSMLLSSKQLEKLPSTASLTVIDREHSRLSERSLQTTLQDLDKKLAESRINMASLLQGKVNKTDAMRLLNLAFKSRDLTKLEPRYEKTIIKLTTTSGSKSQATDGHFELDHLRIMLSLVHYCLQEAASDDQYFKSSYLNEICSHFELGLFNAHIYEASRHSKTKVPIETTALMNLINKNELQNEAAIYCNANDSNASVSSISSAKKSANAKGKQKQLQQQNQSPQLDPSQGNEFVSTNNSRDLRKASKQIRHLLELLGSAMEAYYELNSFLNYPGPKLAVHRQLYNPILVYNLSLYSHNNPNNKTLIRFG